MDCKFVPEPDTITRIRISISLAYFTTSLAQGLKRKAGLARVVGMSEREPLSKSTMTSVLVWSRSTFLVFVLMLGLAPLGGIWSTLALGLALLAAGLAITSLVKMSRAGFPGFSIFTMVLALLWTLFTAFGLGIQLLFMSTAEDYRTCMDQAVTISRQELCASKLNEGLMRDLLGR